MTSTSFKPKKYRLHPRFYVIVTIILALLGWAIYAVAGLMAPARIQWGRLDKDNEIEAIIIRDETVIPADEYGRLECLVAEGEMVEAGATVAKLYLYDSSLADIKNLIDIQQNIKDHQTTNILKNIIMEDLDYLEIRINEMIDEISQLARTHQERDIPLKERELKILMEQRRRYMNENLEPDTSLEKLFQQEDVLVRKIDQNSTTIFAPSSGVVSFFLDGLEENLNFDLVQVLDADGFEVLNRALEKTYPKTNFGADSKVNAEQEIYRIVNPNEWYALMRIPRSRNVLKSGDYCDMQFDGYSMDLVTGYVEDVRDAGRDVIIIMKFNAPIGPMATLRVVSGHIGQSAEGFLIPREYMTSMYDQIGLIVKKDEGPVFIPVNVLGQNTTHVVVEPYDGAQYNIEVGQRLVKP